MAEYNKKLLYEFSDRLYSKAESVILIYTLIGILAGGSTFLFSKTMGIILACIFGFIGFLIGNEKAFWYKFQAQTVLCQAKIEENTSQNLQVSSLSSVSCLDNKKDTVNTAVTRIKNEAAFLLECGICGSKNHETINFPN